MFLSISNEIHEVDGQLQMFFRITYLDGSTMLFSDVDECFRYANDKRYNYRSEGA